MTPKQQIKRWRCRHDYMEDWLINVIILVTKIDRDAARAIVQEQCERAMTAAGLKYPLDPNDV